MPFYSLLGVSDDEARRLVEALEFAVTFYSLLGVSDDYIRTVMYGIYVTFYSLLGVSRLSVVSNELHRGLYFLLPFGSFVARANRGFEVFDYGPLPILSTPFWEFRE